MIFGALLGGLPGEGCCYLAPAASKNSYAIVGAEAMLASALQGPLSSAVVMPAISSDANSPTCISTAARPGNMPR